jgi:hypothetical protein
MIRAWAVIVFLAACGSGTDVVDDPATYVLSFEVEAEGSTRVDPSIDAGIFLARSEREANRAARRVGIDEVSDMLRSWTRYEDRALIAVVGRSGSDQETRLRVDLVQGPALVSMMMVTARTNPVPEFAPVVPSAPWTVVSVSGDGVSGAHECVLLIDEVELTSPCVPIDA